MIDKLFEMINDSEIKKLRLFFVTRKLKNNVKARDRIIDKYEFKTYKVNIDDEVRESLYQTLNTQIKKINDNNYTVEEFNIISDDTKKILSYNAENVNLSFKKVVAEQLRTKSIIPAFEGVSVLQHNEQLWAYTIGLPSSNDDWCYAFKKILSGKVLVDYKDNPRKSSIKRAIRTIFNDSSKSLEFMHGETINLDNLIDCFYVSNHFYIIHKANFEKIVNLEVEYMETAFQMVDEMNKTSKIVGAEVLMEALEKNPKYHKKLVKIKALGLYERIDEPHIFNKMINVAEELNIELKQENGKFKIEDEKDVETIVKFLCEYYKISPVTGDYYATYSGSVIKH